MTTLQKTLLIVDAVFWLGVVCLKAVRPQSSTLSRDELKRREASGDSEAAYEVRRVELLPRLHGLRWLAETLVIFVAITIVFQVLKPVSAIMVGFVLLLLTDILSRQPRIVRAAGQWLLRHEPTLLRRAERWGWLDLFRRSEAERSFQVGSRDELVALIDQSSHDVVSRDEKAMLIAQLGFSHKKVADVMTPRSMIDSVDIKETIGPLLLDKLHRTGHSRFPVIEGDDDHVVGMLYLQELVGTRGAPDTVKKAMKGEVYYIGEGRDLEHALHAFLRSHHHLFIVVNEYRETVGVLSLEDVIETMIGRSIVDEFDEFDDLRAVAHTNPKANNAPKGKQDI